MGLELRTFLNFALALLISAAMSALGQQSAKAEELKITPCNRLQAEAAELQRATPVACEESKETHASHLKAFPEVLESCRKLESEVSSGPKLAPGNENETRNQIMELKQKHMASRQALEEHLAHDLLRTPVDSDDPARTPAAVSSECGTELEGYIRYRRGTLGAISEYYQKLSDADDSLLSRADELSTSDLRKSK